MWKLPPHPSNPPVYQRLNGDAADSLFPCQKNQIFITYPLILGLKGKKPKATVPVKISTEPGIHRGYK